MKNRFNHKKTPGSKEKQAAPCIYKDTIVFK